MSLKELVSEKLKGTFPETWLLDRLDKFWSVSDCKHVTADFVESGFPLASIKEVQSKFVQLANAKQTTKHFYDLLIEGGRRPVPGDLIISRNATVGAVAQVAVWHPKFAMGQDVCLLRRRDEQYSSDYLQAILQSSIVEKQLSDMMVGSTFKRINVQQIKSFFVPVPLPEEQKAIASALSDVDALIAGLEKLIAKKRDLKQAAMQQLLTGQTRLPGFSGEWVRNELKNLVSTPITDGPHLTPTFYETGVPFLSVNNLANNRIDWSDLRFISKADDEIFSRKCKPRKGDVLLGKAASVGKVAIVEDDFDFNIWSPIALIRAGGQVNGIFLYYQLLNADCITQVLLLTNSSSQGNIGMGDIEKLQISYPCYEEQMAIAKVLADMDAELGSLETRLVKTRELKQGMMQELLTGRTRLI